MSGQTRHIEDVLQEITATQCEMDEMEAHLAQLESELSALGGLTRLDCDLVEMFKGIPQVSAIYRYDNRAWVFHDNPVYDAQLMETLYWYESEFLQEHQEHLHIRYIPDVLAPEHRDVVGEARLLYRREEG